MLGSFTSQVVAGIIAAILYDHAIKEGISRLAENHLQPSAEYMERRRKLEDDKQKVEELGESATSGDPEKIFELAILGLDEYFDNKNVETASVGLLSVLVEIESCGDRWEQYAKRSRTFLSSYLATPYITPDDVTPVC